MKKLIFLIMMFPMVCFAGTWSDYYTYGTNAEVNAARLNGNIDNGQNVVNGGLDNTNADTASGYRFYESLGSNPSAGTDGRCVYNTANDTFYCDNGTAFRAPVPKDVDGDTMVQVEESADEDKIRFDTGGPERARIDSNGLLI